MSKILWIDTETTGTDENKHGIFQLSGLIQIDGKIVETFDFFLDPGEDCEFDPNALKLTGKTIEEIRSYDDEFIVFPKFMEILDKYIDKYDKQDKFILAGYNVHFDMRFLYKLAIKNKEDYLFSYIQGGKLEVMGLAVYVVTQIPQRKEITSYKLEAMCILFGIEIGDAHNSMSDIVATFKLFKVLTKEYIPIQNL